MTTFFLLILLFLFLFVTFFPLRHIIVTWLTYKFYKGQFYHKKRVRNNREVCKIELRNFCDENKITLNNDTDEWEVQLGKQMTLVRFEQKLLQFFQEKLKIYLPTHILKTHKTPELLYEYVSMTRSMLKLQANDRNEIHLENNPRIYRRGIPGYIYYYNFIMNRVPSDLYLFKNPKTGQKVESTQTQGN